MKPQESGILQCLDISIEQYLDALQSLIVRSQVRNSEDPPPPSTDSTDSERKFKLFKQAGHGHGHVVGIFCHEMRRVSDASQD